MKVIFVVGTTASGKSQKIFDLCVELNNQKRKSAIVNCDSIQAYQSLVIGSAAPSEEEKSRVDHFLYNYVEKGKELTAGEYRRNFFECLEKIHTSYENVFVVGGTGFYFQSIEKGMYPVSAVNQVLISELERQLETPMGVAQLYAELLEKDPVAALRISKNDHYRIARAIEMMRTHGKSVTEVVQEFEAKRQPFPFPLTKWGLFFEKEILLERIQMRTAKMVSAGLLQEVRSRIDEGFVEWAPLNSVGYREAKEFILSEKAENDLNLGDLKRLIAQSTAQLAKKQRTWFKRDSGIKWFNAATMTGHDLNQALC